MKTTIKKLQKKIEEMISKVPEPEYVYANSIKTLSAAILDLSLAEKAKTR